MSAAVANGMASNAAPMVASNTTHVTTEESSPSNPPVYVKTLSAITGEYAIKVTAKNEKKLRK